MSTILQQLRAEYEASTQREWEVFARQGLDPSEEEWFLGYEITGPEQPTRGQFVRRSDAAFCVSAHNHMPQVLAVAEAAAQIGAAWRAIQNHFNDIEIPMNVLWAAYYDAIDRTEAAIAPLLDEAQ